jgi:uncharacterized protein (DUF488 family)
MNRPFFTIGHSTRSIAEFVDLVRGSNIGLVVDVRTIPMSRKNPQYNIDALPLTLSEYHIGYEHIPSLGGRRGREFDVPNDLNAFWQNQSFHNYADYARGREFQSGLARLRELGHATTCVTMCAEAVWWRCHRRIIADYLVAAGEAVFHIMTPKKVEAARLTSAASIEIGGLLAYPSAALMNKKTVFNG